MRQEEQAGPFGTAPTNDTPVAREGILPFVVAVALVLLASVVNFLHYHDYPLWRSDSAIATALLLATGLVFSVLYAWRNLYWRALLQALLVFLAVDLNADDLRIALVITAAVPAFVIIKNRSILWPLSLLAVIVLITSFMGLGAANPFEKVQRKPHHLVRGEQPAILHMILDEHIGIEGLQNPDGYSVQTRSQLKQAYLDQGFRVYGRAYSRHFHTVNAIPWMMNFGQPVRSVPTMHGVRVGPNGYFEYLEKAGYRVNILQPAFANFCLDSSYTTCTTYFPQSLRALDGYRFSNFERAKLIYFKFLALSKVIVEGGRYFNQAAASLTSAGISVPRVSIKQRSGSSTLAGFAAFDPLIADLKRAKPGDVFFAHLLLPHTPYIKRSDCSTLPPSEWEDRDSQSSLKLKQRRYLDQVRCTARKVEQAVASLEQSPAAKNFVVIVHGDHGSRITRKDPDVPNLGKFDSRDMIAGFSTFFAIRGSGLVAEYVDEPVPMDSLLSQFAKSDFKVAPLPPGEARMTVFLDDQYWRPHGRANMPNEWAAPLALVHDGKHQSPVSHY